MIKGVARVTTAAGTSSSVNVTIGYTEDDAGQTFSNNVQGFQTGNLSPAVVVTPANGTTSTGCFYFLDVINARAGIAIKYSTTYASNPASAMVYSLHLVASRF